MVGSQDDNKFCKLLKNAQLLFSHCAIAHLGFGNSGGSDVKNPLSIQTKIRHYRLPSSAYLQIKFVFMRRPLNFDPLVENSPSKLL